ncbi:MAG: putative Ig domain-containing protein [Candidatus Competibacteraceae bacterium]|nr:putative Ig domain-containing protein [Candidatus Competibacteraceae bacterium]
MNSLCALTKRLVVTLALVLIPLSVLADLQQSGLTLQGRSVSGRSTLDMHYRVQVTNNGTTPVTRVTARVVSNSPHTEILDDELSFPDLSANAQASSTDTFTLRQNRRVRLNVATDLTFIFDFEVQRGDSDTPPDIISSPITQGSLQENYQYDVEASDPDAGEVLTYTLRVAPPGMTIDSDSGLIQWTPADTGAADVDVQVTDSTGLTDRQIYLIRVDRGENDQPPTLTPLNDQSTVLGEMITVQAMGSDPEGETLRYDLSSAPEGMIINVATGDIRWTPGADQVGSTAATVSVTDPGGQSAQTSFSVQVRAEPINRPPVLKPIADRTVEPLSPVILQLQATDPDAEDILVFDLDGLPDDAHFDANSGTFNWIPDTSQVGVVNLTATVTDSAGDSDSQSVQIQVRESAAPPVAGDDAYTLNRLGTHLIEPPGVLANDSDPNNDLLTTILTGNPDLGMLDDFPGDGSFVYSTPPTPLTQIGLDLQCQADGGFSINTTAVGDIDRDGDVELVGVGIGPPNNLGSSIIIFDGRDCSIESRVDLHGQGLGQLTWRSLVTLVDLDDDADLEIVLTAMRFHPQVSDESNRLVALNRDGTPVWSITGHVTEQVSFDTCNHSGQTYRGPTAVDLDADGTAELLHGWTNVCGGLGAVVAYNGRTGEILWEYLGPPQTSVGDGGAKGPVIADLDLDGQVEIIWHTSVLDPAGNLKFLLPTELTLANGTGSPHLTVAVANFDNDPFPEIIANDNNNHYLYEHTGTVKWQRPTESINLPATDMTVAQLDDDPQPEYLQIRNDRNNLPGEVGNEALAAFDSDGTLLWDHDDRGWRVRTFWQGGISTPVAFDFDQDGIDEVVLNHPGSSVFDWGLYIFDGRSGDTIARADMEPQRTTGNNPLTIADVDGDGAAEIVIIPNNRLSTNDTIQIWQGLPGNPYPPARAIRNQTVYQPTWVNDDGTLPPYPEPHWLIPGLNKFYASPVIPGESPQTIDRFRYKVTDGSADSNEATVTLTLAQVNAPTILSRPPLGASPGFEYVYGLLASDADFGDTLTWTLVDGPGGMAIDSFGVLTWTPGAGELGSHRVHIVVIDSEGHSDDQIYQLDVLPPVTVPDLLGLNTANAADALTGKGLAVGDVTETFSLTVPAGKVVSQSVMSGAETAAGAQVDYVVSLGPPPIIVPDVVALSEAVATTTLADVGLTVGNISYTPSETKPRGVVIAQSLAPQTQVVQGTPVDLTLSGGPPLTLSLERNLLGPEESIGFELAAFDATGAPQPLPGDLSLVIESDGDTAGPLPLIVNQRISAGADTRGDYRLRVQSPLLGVDVQAPFTVAKVLAGDGVQASYGAFSAQLNDLVDRYDTLSQAVQDGDLLKVRTIASQLQAIHDALDLDDLALTPATALSSGFLPDNPPDFPSSADSAFGNQLTLTVGALTSTRHFLERLDPKAGRNDDIRARVVNQALETQLERFDTTTLTRRGTVLFSGELHRLLSVEFPALVAADLDVLLMILADAGLLVETARPGAFYDGDRLARTEAQPTSLESRPAFFTLGGMASASTIRMKLVKKHYYPIVKQVLKNTQNLVAEGLIKTFFDPAAIPGIVTGASQSFHTFELGNSIIEAYTHAAHPSGNRVQMIGPTLVADLAAAVDGVRKVRFRTMKQAKAAIKTIKSAAQKTATTFKEGFKEFRPSATLNGCVFDTAPDCRQLGFSDGLPVVHKSGNFPGPVLILVYDGSSGNISIGNFLFFPKGS